MSDSTENTIQRRLRLVFSRRLGRRSWSVRLLHRHEPIPLLGGGTLTVCRDEAGNDVIMVQGWQQMHRVLNKKRSKSW